MNVNFATLDETDVTASDEDANFPASNLKHAFRSKRWRSPTLTSSNVVFDIQTAEPIDTVVLLWPKEDGITLSNSAIVKIQANATDVWSSPSVDQTLTIDNDYEVCSHHFSTDQEYRYWRLVIEDPGNPNGYLELGVIWLGKSIDIENAQNGFKFSRTDRSKKTRTEFGNVYSDLYPTLTSVDFQYEFLDYDVIQVLDNAFLTNGSTEPVLVVFDEDATVSDKDHFLIYGLFDDSFSMDHVMYDIFNTQLSIQEIS